MKYFIHEHLHRETFDGGIGNVDMEKVFLNAGFKAIRAPGHFDFSQKAKLRRLAFIVKMFVTIPSNSQVVFQFPLYARMHRLLVRMLLLKRNISVICLIADIDGMRDGNKDLLKKEIRRLRRFRYFIVHNAKMQQWLKAIVPRARSVSLNFFPFLTNAFAGARDFSGSPAIVFAGNLAKGSFVNKLGELAGFNFRFSVYGDGQKESLKQSNVAYNGLFKPYELPAVVDGNYSLVWDGDAINTCGGSYGRYLLINTPHKISFSILSRLPVITWQNAAIASFVKEYQIGFTVNSLFEIEDRLKNITADEYRQMIANMDPLIESISSGKTLVNALDEVDRMIGSR